MTGDYVLTSCLRVIPDFYRNQETQLEASQAGLFHLADLNSA